MEKIKILFVCKGNICRSTMAQFLTLHKLKENDIKEHFYIDSAATGDRQIGKGIAPGTIQKLEENNIEYQERYARMLLKEEYGDFDYIVAMDESIKEDVLKIVSGDPNQKVYMLYDFAQMKFDIEDPGFTNDFDRTYREINYGCDMFVEFLKNKYTL